MTDNDIIQFYGGSTALARELGLDKSKGGAQRVNNWKTRGIPPAVKLSRPDLFLRHLLNKKPRITRSK